MAARRSRCSTPEAPARRARELLLSRTPPVIAPGHSSARHRQDRRHRPDASDADWWFFGFAVAFFFLMVLNLTIVKLLFTGIGIWAQHPGRLGVRHHQLRLVDRIGHAGTLISRFFCCFASSGARRSTASPKR